MCVLFSLDSMYVHTVCSSRALFSKEVLSPKGLHSIFNPLVDTLLATLKKFQQVPECFQKCL
jgi:hypothetical protein